MQLHEKLHRLAKRFVDNGSARTIDESIDFLEKFRVVLQIEESDLIENQIALLTSIALASRICLGGVYVYGKLDVPLKLKFPAEKTLGDAVKKFGGIIGTLDCHFPTISISVTHQDKNHDFHIRTLFAGWRGGILPVNSKIDFENVTPMPLAPMLSAALAINELFQFFDGFDGEAGHRKVGLSLWNPNIDVDWWTKDSTEVPLKYLPQKLWLIGLGHLGQAYLWALGLLPYPNPEEFQLTLQDYDEITESSVSTSILTDSALVGQKKTRTMANWAESIGFKTNIIERIFDDKITIQEEEATIALCGLDNAIGRQVLDQVGFDFVFEAGLGRDHRTFQEIRTHALPATRRSSEIWKNDETEIVPVNNLAYSNLLENSVLDECGIVQLAEKAVGAPFVGSVAACLVISEVLKLLHNGKLSEQIDLDLSCVDFRRVVENNIDFSSKNPGFITI